MAKTDIIFLHPPTVYDFRKLPILHGPISDVIPSTPIFEMYPVGFTSLSEFLERHGIKTRIINVAMKMLKSKTFDVEKMIKKLNPTAFAIDLHWMPHVNGSIALANIIKRYHPETPVIFGGFSSTYYHKELIQRYPQIDYVVRGDSTEEPLLQLINAIKNNKSVENIPNITWRGKNGKVNVNPFSYVPETLNNVVIDYSLIMKKVVRFRDLVGYLPFFNWSSYPITAVFTCRGCTHNCRTCGGSAKSFSKWFNRKRPAYRSPELLAEDIYQISRHLGGPIFIIGDITQPGEDYYKRLLLALKPLKIKNHLVFEFFKPPEDKVLEAIRDAVKNVNVEISPESHDEKVRKAFGRPYNNHELEHMIKKMVELDFKRIDLFFMIGLPYQTYDSVMGTVEYSDYLLSMFGNKKTLFPFISPLAPFLDPGSIVFENPEKFGYHLFYKSVEEHRLALLNPSWKMVLSYETKWMKRDEIAKASYEAGLRLNRIKAKYGLITKEKAEATEKRIKNAVEVMKKIDEIQKIK
ncbi:MAG: TIGR04190 family B12-binding domain/radical SAM domain protein, partial [Spirochaetes bacterium]